MSQQDLPVSMINRIIFTWKTVNAKPVSAFETEDKGGHRLVSRPCLELVVGALSLAATPALERVGGGAL